MHTTDYLKTTVLNVKCTRENCNQWFRDDYKLTRHLKIHNNEQDKCQYCQFTAITPHCMKDHERKHDRTKLFSCHYCDKFFYDNKVLQQHIYGNHDIDEKRYR